MLPNLSFMAPEVLLQAGRYLAADGMAKSVLDDHMLDPGHLPKVPSAILLEAAYSDFKRGWGIKADVWSWACSTMSLLLRTMPSDIRPSSNSICAFDFCFDRTEDVLEPLHELHSSNDLLPRFHHWARMYPLRIMSVLHCGVQLPECASVFSTAMQRILLATFRQQDQRPSASLVLHILEASMPSKVEGETSSNSSLYSITPHSVDLHATSRSGSLTSAFPNIEDAQNIDLSDSNAISASTSMNPDSVARYYPNQHSFVMLDSPPPKKRELPTNASLSPSSALTAQQKFLQNRLIHSPIASPGLYSAGITGLSSSPARQDSPLCFQKRQTLSSAAAAMDLSPSMSTTALSPNPQTITLPRSIHLAQTESEEDFTSETKHTGSPLPPARLRVLSTSKRSSQGLLGLGIDLGRPLRSVRSFTSHRDPTTPTQASLPRINTTTVMANSALADDNDSSFLLHDPYAAASTQSQQHPKRGRSWSSIFRRKKE
jgi:hypothetical protein